MKKKSFEINRILRLNLNICLFNFYSSSWWNFWTGCRYLVYGSHLVLSCLWLFAFSEG